MGDLAEYWDDYKEYMREKRDREGWISNSYKTEDERDKSVAESHKLNKEIDDYTLTELKQNGFSAERKSESSFQLTTPKGKIMLYTGRKGNKLYYPQKNQTVRLPGSISYTVEQIADGLKQVKW